jgi:GABA permease
MKRLLVVANKTVASSVLGQAVRAFADDDAEVLVIAPVLNSRLGFWSSDDRHARRRAQERVDSCLHALRAAGIEAEGSIADADPLLAIDDALGVFAADAIVLATHPDGRSSWLERDIVNRARARFPCPVHHIMVGSELDERRIA